jgi:hypothetical protein
MHKYFILLWLISMYSFVASAQTKDTLKNNVMQLSDSIIHKSKDTTASKPIKKPKKERVYSPDSTHSPHKAVMRSLMIPGWGQIYNRQYWKVPVIYAGLGTLGYFLVTNQQLYNEFLQLSIYRQRGIIPTKGQSYYNEYNYYTNVQSQAIYDVKDYYRRNRDVTILLTFGAWGINCIEAYVSAKFINAYTVDDNLSMKVAPSLINRQVYAFSNNSPYIPGLKITFTLK